tara:strand:+ start:222 stop:545 length:324 start_codon:yes stop_codon:yes gene_type:complete
MHRLVDGVRIDLSDEEVAQLNAKGEEWKKGAADRALAAIRIERNTRLEATDYAMLSDVAPEDNSAMIAYRKSLRELPDGLDSVAFQTQWYDYNRGKDGISDPWPTKP